MFGFKRKRKSNPILDMIGSNIGYSITNDQDESPKRKVNSNPDNLPLLSNGKKNASITHDMLSLLPVHYRMFGRWQKLDLKKCFEEEPQEPIKPKPPMLQKIPEEKKNKIKAFVLGELEDKGESQ